MVTNRSGLAISAKSPALSPSYIPTTAGVSGIRLLVGRRQPPEGVRREHRALTVVERFEDGPHKDRDTATLYASLDEIARYPLRDDLLDAILHIVETLEADHGLREQRPVTAISAHVRPVEVGLGEFLPGAARISSLGT
jgi:hypothetical protein